MSARNIVGHHTRARFAMIPRVINNVCFNVNLRLGSNLISTEATRSNADGDWLGGIGTQRRTLENRRKGERPSGMEKRKRKGKKEQNGERKKKERERERGEREKEGVGEGERTGEEEVVEEDEQEGPLGIVRGRSLVTRDSCDPDDP